MSSPKSINRLPSLGHEIASDWQSSLSSNGNIFLSPTRPSTDSESCTQTGQQSPKTRQHQSTTGGRFAFTNKLSGRFYRNNTIMSATEKTARKDRKIKFKAKVWDTELQRLQNEIEEVLQLEKKVRAIKEKRRLHILAVKNSSASKIQRVYRLYRILHHRSRRKKKAAAVTLRKLLGGATGRAYAKDATDRINAELLQAILGGSLTGLDPIAYVRYKRDSYAKDIQRWWRYMRQLEVERQAKFLFSVLLLQRVYRGNLARKRARKIAEVQARKALLDMALSGIGGNSGGVFGGIGGNKSNSGGAGATEDETPKVTAKGDMNKKKIGKTPVRKKEFTNRNALSRQKKKFGGRKAMQRKDSLRRRR
jgi:hypothetical protein